MSSLRALRDRAVLLAGQKAHHGRELAGARRELAALRAYLELEPKIEEALELLSQRLFDELIGVLKEKLSIALQEVLEQPITLQAQPDIKGGRATLGFSVERNGQSEDIMRGQGGSVANILSVGLRMFALTTLDPRQHRMFLVLDEQDCWLRPDLVPRLVKIIHDAGEALGLQVLLISHHDVESFRQYAQRVYRLVPVADGSCRAELVS